MNKQLSILMVMMMIAAPLAAMPLAVGGDGVPVETPFAGGDFGGGNGTVWAPYIIEDVDDLQNMSANLSAHYVLGNDIDASATSGWVGGFDPIGNGTHFTGTFNGNNYTIFDLFIDRPAEDNVGLFGRISFPSTISNVVLDNVNVTGEWNVSALVGYSNQGDLSNCHVNGVIWGTTNTFIGGLVGQMNIGAIENSSFSGDVTSTTNYVGGLCGRSTGKIAYCNTTGNVVGGNWVGGLSGDTLGGQTVSHCHVDTNVSGGRNIGGLIGVNGHKVDNCTINGTITGTQDNIGGLLGFTSNDVTDSTSHATVNGTDSTGGLVGQNNGGTISNSYATGNVTGTGDGIGGLVGWDNDGMISNSSASGNVNGSNDAGGLVGYNEGSSVLMNCSASGNVSGTDRSGGLIAENYGYTSNSSATGTVYGIDYVGGLVGANDGTVLNCTSHGAVIGNGNYTGGLIGYSGGPVTKSKSFGDVSNHYPGIGNNYGTGGLIGKLDSSNVSFCKAFGNVNGTKVFTGGLIGHIVSGAIVMNCSAFGVIKAYGSYIGGFVGRNEGTVLNSSTYAYTGENSIHAFVGGFVGDNNGLGVIQNSSAHGDVLGGSQIGGFVGQNTGLIERCFSMGSVNANDKVGGFVGMNGLGSDGNIIDCYSQGNVIGDDRVGGFVGNHTTGTLTNVYSTGLVTGTTNMGGLVGINGTSTVTESHWDIDTSGQATSAGGEGNTTEEMMRQTTFDPPWDFTNIWGIYENNTYPFLRAFGIPPPPVADLEITIDGTPEPCNVGDVLMYTVTVTNNGPDLSVNPVVNITLPMEVIWQDDSQSIGPPTGLYLETAIGNLASGESGGSFINVSVDSYAATITATARIDNVTADSNLTNNIDWANTTINRAPNAVNDNYNVDEDSGPNTLDVLANDNDPDNDDLTITTITQGTNGTVVIIDAGKNVTYEPDADYVGSDTFTYTIDDGNGGTDTATVDVTVINVNDAPVITTTDVVTATEDSLYSVDYNATDIDPSDTLTWSLETDAGWLSIGLSTGVLEGTPTNADVGSYWVNVTVDDGNGGLDWTNFTLTVSNVNDAPVISTTTAPDGTDGQFYSFQANASDDEGDALIWRMRDTNAQWLGINTTGVLSGTPTAAGTFWVDIEVDDSHGGIDSVNLTLVIAGNGTTPPTDTDGDGVPDTDDDFPNDPAASVDTDDDGKPDDWNPGYTADDSTTGLVVDDDDDNDGILDVDDANPLTPDDTGGSNTWLYIILILVIVGAIVGFLLMRGKGAKPVEEPEAIEETDSAGSV